MIFLLIMSGRSFLREAICTFFCGQMLDVETILIETVEGVATLTPDQRAHLRLVLLHIGDQDADAAGVQEDLQVIGSALEGTPTVLLGHREDCSQSQAAIRSGAHGYIPINLPSEIVKHALPLIAGGGVFAPPFLYGELDPAANGWEESEGLPHWPHPTIENAAEHRGENAAEHPGDGDLNSFTDRELDVLKLLGAGLPNKLIAHRLSLREGTVKVHVRNVMRKLGVTSRTQAALVAVRHFTPEAQS